MCIDDYVLVLFANAAGVLCHYVLKSFASEERKSLANRLPIVAPLVLNGSRCDRTSIFERGYQNRFLECFINVVADVQRSSHRPCAL